MTGWAYGSHQTSVARIQIVDGEEVSDFLDEGPSSPADVREWLEAQVVDVHFPTFALNDQLELTFRFEGEDDGTGNAYVMEITFHLSDDTVSVAPTVDDVLKQFT